MSSTNISGAATVEDQRLYIKLKLYVVKTYRYSQFISMKFISADLHINKGEKLMLEFVKKDC